MFWSFCVISLFYSLESGTKATYESVWPKWGQAVKAEADNNAKVNINFWPVKQKLNVTKREGQYYAVLKAHWGCRSKDQSDMDSI